MKKTIVVAEDNDMLSKVLKYRLESDGYDVKVFENGEDALTYMHDNQFDMLITDLYMPMMNGIEVIQIVRETISNAIPIMAISAVHDENMITNIFNSGADDFIIKPFRASELSIRVKRLIDGSN